MFHTAAFHLWYSAESVDQKDYILVLFTSCFGLSILYLGYLSCVDISACRTVFSGGWDSFLVFSCVEGSCQLDDVNYFEYDRYGDNGMLGTTSVQIVTFFPLFHYICCLFGL